MNLVTLYKSGFMESPLIFEGLSMSFSNFAANLRMLLDAMSLSRLSFDSPPSPLTLWRKSRRWTLICSVRSTLVSLYLSLIRDPSTMKRKRYIDTAPHQVTSSHWRRVSKANRPVSSDLCTRVVTAAIAIANVTKKEADTTASASLSIACCLSQA